MPTLKEFVDALQAGWFPALAALIGCSIVVAGDWYSLPYIHGSPSYFITTAVVVGVFSFSILAANAAYLPVVLCKMLRAAQKRKAFRQTLQKELANSPPEERAILAYLITSGRRAFVARFDHRGLAPLVAKGILHKQGGVHSVLEWPYVVQNDVWEFLQAHRDEYPFKDAWAIGDPFHPHSHGHFGAEH